MMDDVVRAGEKWDLTYGLRVALNSAFPDLSEIFRTYSKSTAH